MSYDSRADFVTSAVWPPIQPDLYPLDYTVGIQHGIREYCYAIIIEVSVFIIKNEKYFSV
jgi:hypothetical protein